MQITGKVPTIFDEAGFGDSFMRSSLWKIQGSTFVRGSFTGSDIQDFYKLDLSAGEYTLYLTTEGLNAQSVFNSSFRLEIVDSIGQVVLGEDSSHIDAFTDQIAFRYSGTGDYYARITSFNGADFSYRAAVYQGPPPASQPPQPPLPDDWKLFATSGFLGAVGSGTVYGTSATERIVVLNLAQTVAFDASFNRGNDSIRLIGDASRWAIGLSASTVVPTDGDTNILIPIGVGTFLEFDDGVRQLFYDATAGTAKIGNQAFGNTGVVISAPSDPAITLPAPDPSATAKVFMAAGGEAVVGGNVSVIGTSSDEFVGLLVGRITLDGSFNRGGDEIYLFDAVTAYTAQRSGSSLILTGTDVIASIPYSDANVELLFAGSPRDMYFDPANAQLFVGTQQIGNTASFLIA